MLQGIDGVLELIGRTALFSTAQRMIIGAVGWLTRKELLEDEDDFIANQLVHWRSSFPWVPGVLPPSTCLAHGLVEIGPGASLLRSRDGRIPPRSFVAPRAISLRVPFRYRRRR